MIKTLLPLLCLLLPLGGLLSAAVVEDENITAPQPDLQDGFGYAVAIDGNTMVITSPYEDSNATGVNGDQTNDTLPSAGAAYVFGKNGDSWVFQAYLKAPNPDQQDTFGASVAISGDIIVIGAVGEDGAATGVNGAIGSNAALGAGAAYVYVRSGNTWAYNAYLKASNTNEGDGFGYSVGISGNTIVVGALYEDSAGVGVGSTQTSNAAENAGAAYVFLRSGNSWVQQAYLKPTNTGAGDLFGISTSISGDTIAVGAVQEDSSARTVNGLQTDNSAADAGAAYVFVRNGAAWTQQAYIKSSNADAEDRFGHSVSVRGNLLVAGAIWEDSAATLVNGTQTSNATPFSGAAYVFQRTGTAWAQQAYLKSSHPDQQDLFGFSVAAGDDAVLIGVPYEDSSARAVDGNAADNSVGFSGAAFLYTRSGTTWTKQAYLKSTSSVTNGQFGWSVALAGSRALAGSHGALSVPGGTLSGFATVFDGVGPGPLALWRQTWFSTQANTGNAADSADPDRDGLINLVEFATGSNPLVFSTKPGVISRSGSDALFTWYRNIGVTAENISIFPQWSNDLQTWNDWGMTNTESVPGGSGIITTRLFSPGDPVFMRLRVVK